MQRTLAVEVAVLTTFLALGGLMVSLLLRAV